MDLSTKPKHILDTFQNCDLSPAEWEKLADQVLKRGDQKVADEVRGRNQPASKKDKKFDLPKGASDDSIMEDTGVRRSSKKIGSQTMSF